MGLVHYTYMAQMKDPLIGLWLVHVEFILLLHALFACVVEDRMP